jgi:hypothetical protein
MYDILEKLINILKLKTQILKFHIIFGFINFNSFNKFVTNFI